MKPLAHIVAFVYNKNKYKQAKIKRKRSYKMRRYKWVTKKVVAVSLALTCALTCLTGCSDKKVAVMTEAVESSIYVEPIEGLSEDFIKGMDISSVLAEEASGVVYYGQNGKEADLFHILADAGVNYVRVRVWNDPYDKDGNGYGGGNNDVEKAAIIGERAAEYGMKLLVDFHYSDFWADPSKQFAPKEWKHLTFEDKKQALYDFTLESLRTISESGADIGMVQIGNEINNGMAGETDQNRVMELLKQGSSAVRAFSAEVDKDIEIAVHYTNIEDTNKTLSRAATLENAGVDYDIFGVSYYAFWHGSMENLTDVLTRVSEQYGKKTCVLETSYAYTLEDGDGYGDSVGEKDLVEGYAATMQSQVNCVRDVCAAAAAADSMGVFYWEGAWIPVPVPEGGSRAEVWEQQGSGWASSYAAKYDPNDAGLYYGGCSWDNQAFFDANGQALETLNVFKYLNYGTVCEPAVDYIEDVVVEVNEGEEVRMPETVYATFNNRELSSEISVNWDEDAVSKIDTNVSAEHTINGTLEDGTSLSATVKVAQVNYLKNPSFELGDVSMWKVTPTTATNPTDIQKKETDAFSGEKSFHFWDSNDFGFEMEQTVEGLAAGKYNFEVNLQGGDMGKNAVVYLYVIEGDAIYESEPVTLDGWCNWKTPEIKGITLATDGAITVGVHVESAGGGWGTMDDFYLYKIN